MSRNSLTKISLSQTLVRTTKDSRFVHNVVPSTGKETSQATTNAHIHETSGLNKIGPPYVAVRRAAPLSDMNFAAI